MISFLALVVQHHAPHAPPLIAPGLRDTLMADSGFTVIYV